jgi:hypothetical protein
VTSGWTTPADLRTKVRRRWTDGSLLRALAAGEPFPTLDLPVHGPRPGDIGDDLLGVQRWIGELERGSANGRCYALVTTAIGGRHFGRNSVPSRALVTTYEQAWRLLGTTAQVADYRRLLDQSGERPEVRAWAAAHPLRALDLSGEWEQVLAACAWLDGPRAVGRFLREITAPGVDTKFVERHRSVLGALLGVPAGAGAFVTALGLRAKPETVRLRFDAGLLGMPVELSEATVRAEELASLRVTVRAAVVVENEITYLSVPVPAGGVVLWGQGFDVRRAAALPWLQQADLHYWGDLDTHGFAILHQLRAVLPQTQSFLMDRQTLLRHRDRWGEEQSPTAARLDRLTAAESELYAELVSDRWGDAVRLEQERVDWSWVQARLPYAARPGSR